MKRLLLALCFCAFVPMCLLAQWTNPPTPDPAPGPPQSSVTALRNEIRARVPKPTNTWTAGYVLSTSDGGTTTFAQAAGGAELDPVWTAASTGYLTRSDASTAYATTGALAAAVTGLGTDTVARAWAQAGSNQAALAQSWAQAGSNQASSAVANLANVSGRVVTIEAQLPVVSNIALTASNAAAVAQGTANTGLTALAWAQAGSNLAASAYGWGNHATGGYASAANLSSVSASVATVTANLALSSNAATAGLTNEAALRIGADAALSSAVAAVSADLGNYMPGDQVATNLFGLAIGKAGVAVGTNSPWYGIVANLWLEDEDHPGVFEPLGVSDTNIYFAGHQIVFWDAIADEMANLGSVSNTAVAGSNQAALAQSWAQAGSNLAASALVALSNSVTLLTTGKQDLAASIVTNQAQDARIVALETGRLTIVTAAATYATTTRVESVFNLFSTQKLDAATADTTYTTTGTTATLRTDLNTASNALRLSVGLMDTNSILRDAATSNLLLTVYGFASNAANTYLALTGGVVRTALFSNDTSAAALTIGATNAAAARSSSDELRFSFYDGGTNYKEAALWVYAPSTSLVFRRPGESEGYALLGYHNFSPSTYLSVSAAQSNYFRWTSTTPTNSTASGSAYQVNVTANSATSVWVYVYYPVSSKWYRAQFTEF